MTTFTDILGGPRPLTLQGGLKVSYSPGAVTPASMGQILEAGASEDGLAVLDAYKRVIPMFVLEWDLEYDGVPVPLTPEGVAEVPLAILDLVFEAIMSDRERRASEEGNVSGASTVEPPQDSTTPPSMVSPQNGTGSYVPQGSITAAHGSS